LFAINFKKNFVNSTSIQGQSVAGHWVRPRTEYDNASICFLQEQCSTRDEANVSNNRQNFAQQKSSTHWPDASIAVSLQKATCGFRFVLTKKKTPLIHKVLGYNVGLESLFHDYKGELNPEVLVSTAKSSRLDRAVVSRFTITLIACKLTFK